MIEVPTILLVGPTGVGKSTAVLRALKNNAFYVAAERGALAIARNPAIYTGPAPDVVECMTTVAPWVEVLRAVRQGCAGVRAGKYSAIVIDTLSSLADREYDYLVATESTGHGREWNLLAAHVRPIVNEAIAAEAIVVCIAHQKDVGEKEPKTKLPRLPGKLGEEVVPSLFDVVVRLDWGAGPNGEAVRMLRCQPRPRWADKDRHGVVIDGEVVGDDGILPLIRRCVQRARGLVVDMPVAVAIGAAKGLEL